MAYQYGMPGQAYVPGIAANQSLATSQMQATLESQQQLRVQLATFWQSQMEEIQNIGPTSSEFKTQQLPLTRIKKIMKSDEAVRMISAEAPMLLSKASEIFIHELSLRAWNHAEQNKRRTLQKNDIDNAVTMNDAFDFLVDIIGYPNTTAETGGAMGPMPGMAYMPINGAGMPYDATVLGVPTVGVPTSEPAEHAEEQGGQGVGSSGEVNEEGQTSFV